MATLAAVSECSVPDPTQLAEGYSPALWAILKKALAKKRDERYATAKEMADALDEFSRSRGRVVTTSTVAAYMAELFGEQRTRYKEWLDEIGSEKPIETPEESFRGPSDGRRQRDPRRRRRLRRRRTRDRPTEKTDRVCPPIARATSEATRARRSLRAQARGPDGSPVRCGEGEPQRLGLGAGSSVVGAGTYWW